MEKWIYTNLNKSKIIKDSIYKSQKELYSRMTSKEYRFEIRIERKKKTIFKNAQIHS